MGGTGPAGIGLAEQFAAAGHNVLVGSRTPERAARARETVLATIPATSVTAMTNDDAVQQADVVFLTVPFDAQRPTVEGIADKLDGKIVVSIANPLRVANKRAVFEPPSAGSLAEEIAMIAPGARIVGALHEIRVSRFADLSHEIHSDTIVTGDDDEAKRIVMDLCHQIRGVRAIDGGSLSNTRYVEGFVTVLVAINFRYKAGVSYRITGLKD
ncbi:MAG: NADPH-dependent F420 reductase [Actinomycetota bacterium]